MFTPFNWKTVASKTSVVYNPLCLVSFYIYIKDIEPEQHSHHFMSDYIHSGQLLIDIPIKKVIYIDSRFISLFNSNKDTILIPITLNDFALYKEYYARCGTDGDVDVLTPNKDKDTAIYHLLQLSKTAFVERAIKLNPFASEIFAWIDFGIRKIFKTDELMTVVLTSLKDNIINVPKDAVLMPSCWPLDSQDHSEFDRILWYMCGGFFIGYKDQLLKFANAVVCESMNIIEIEHKLTFEVNVWFRIWRNMRFSNNQNHSYTQGLYISCYKADHDSSLFSLSSTPQTIINAVL